MARFSRKRTTRRFTRRKGKKWSPTTIVRTRQPDTFDVARSAWTGVKKIWRMINVETKYIQTNIAWVANTDITYDGRVASLCTVPVGNGNSERNGVSIRPLNLTFKYWVQSTATSLSNGIRIIIFRGKYENDVDPVPGDVLDASLLGNVSNKWGLIASKEYDKRYKTKILYDKTHWITATTAYDSGRPAMQTVHKVIRLGGHVNYDVSQTDGTDIEDGGVYLLAYTPWASGASPNTLSFMSRLTYTDN